MTEPHPQFTSIVSPRNAQRRVPIGRILTIVTMALVATALAKRLDPLAEGLSARYLAEGPKPRPASVPSASSPATDSMLDVWRGSIPEIFNATWTGSIVILRDAEYTFTTISDYHSSVFIDGSVVLENPAVEEPKRASGTVHLTRGVHAMYVQYDHAGGPVRLEWLWARDGESATAVPAWTLHPGKPRSAALGASLALMFALIGTEWMWVSACVLCVGIGVSRAVGRIRGVLADEDLWRHLKWILAGSLVLNATAVWWGLPAIWVPDELTPSTVIDGLSQHFSHGWYDRWPPLHYYLLALTMSPVVVLDWMGRISLTEGVWPVVLVLMGRGVSLCAAAGTLVAICRTGAHAFGARVGLLAAAIFALDIPFVYYAKTANLDVPYVFWFAVSLMFYVRLARDGRLRDYVLFATYATFAICTKDQAYALYLAAPFALVYQRWRDERRRGTAGWHVLFDRRLVVATTTAVVIFVLCHNLVFNFHGFLEHVKFITGSGHEDYRMFPPTLAGRTALLLVTGHLVRISWGWPLALVSAMGLVVAVATPRQRHAAIWLLLPVLAYYFGFINVILYNYDRFVLPMCVILAMFGGVALDRFLGKASGLGSWRLATVGAVFAYTLLYASTVDALMLTDSRYAVERWIDTYVRQDEVVATTGPAELLPRLSHGTVDIGSVPALENAKPAYFVLSADYAHAVRTDTVWGQLIAGLERETAGYRLVGRFRSRSPWRRLPGAHPDLVGDRLTNPSETEPFRVKETGIFTVLRDIDPTIEVFRRDASARLP